MKKEKIINYLAIIYYLCKNLIEPEKMLICNTHMLVLPIIIYLLIKDYILKIFIIESKYYNIIL